MGNCAARAGKHEWCGIEDCNYEGGDSSLCTQRVTLTDLRQMKDDILQARIDGFIA